MTEKKSRKRGPQSGSFGDYLKARRIGLDKKQGECAAEVGVPSTVWSAWERDRRRPTSDKLEPIASSISGSLATLKKKWSDPCSPKPVKFRRGGTRPNGTGSTGLTPDLLRRIADAAEHSSQEVITPEWFQVMVELASH